METIGSSTIQSFLGNDGEPERVSNTKVRASPGFSVGSYLELATRIATLNYLNPDYVLMFRGQSGDFLNRQRNTTLKPTIARPFEGGTIDYLARYERLRRAEELLVESYRQAGFRGHTRLQRQRILRWSILQHYEVCDTPLLDVTQSLRIAASFASKNGTGPAYVFVLGVPNLSGAITASAEAGIQVVRLSSVCPPEAVRPHIQEGYLLGEYPDMDGAEQKNLYPAHEIDFGLRLIGKFRFDPGPFWAHSADFPRVPTEALYPSASDDPLRRMGDRIRNSLPSV